MTATLKTTIIQEPSSATANMTLDTSGGVAFGQNLSVAGTATFTGAATFTGGSSSLKLNGSTSGTTTLSPSATASGTITLPAGTGTVAVNGVSSSVVSGTAVAATSGTSIDFTSIPSWVKRITVMFNNISTSGTNSLSVKAGTSGGIDSTNYTSNRGVINNTSVFVISTTTSFDLASFATAAILNKGHIILTNISGNIWVASGCITDSGTQMSGFAGTVSLTGVLTTIRVTSIGSTDTFDAGSVNIFYE